MVFILGQINKNLIFIRIILLLHASFIATEKTRDQRHDKIATALAGAILSNAFDQEFFPGGNKT
jgi:hypothetical protein